MLKRCLHYLKTYSCLLVLSKFTLLALVADPSSIKKTTIFIFFNISTNYMVTLIELILNGMH